MVFALSHARKIDQDALSRALEVILWTLMAVALLGIPAGYLIPEMRLRTFVAALLFYVLCLPLLLLNRRGHFRLASVLLVGGTWAITALSALNSGATQSRAVFFLLPVIFISGLLLGPRVGIAVTLLCILTVLGLAVFEITSPVPLFVNPSKPLSRWLGFMYLSVMMMSLQFLAARTIGKAFLRSREELEKRERAEAALSISEERYRKMAQSFPNGAVLLFDRDLRCLLADGQGLGPLGLSKVEFEDLSIWNSLSPESADAVKQLCRSSFAGEIQESIVVFGDRTCDVHVAPIRNDDGEVINGMLVVQDVTEREEAERRARQLAHFLSMMREIVIVTDMDDRFIYWNKGAEQRLGWSAQEALGKTSDELFSKDSQMTIKTIRQTVIDTGTWQGELLCTTRSGDIFPTETSWTLVRDTAGQPAAVVSIATDITEHRRAEEALKANEELLREFIKHAPAAIAMFDKDMRYLQVSDRFLTEYRLEGRNLIGESHYDVFPDLPARWKEVHQRILCGAVERCDEDSYTGPDGSTEWLQWESLPWRKAGGEIGGLILFTQVITERKRAEKALRASEERFAKIFKLSPCRMGILRRSDAVILDVNDCWERESGYSREEAINHSIFELTALATPVTTPRIRKAIETGTWNSELETRVGTKNGAERTVIVAVEQVQLGDDDCLLWASKDITERKLAEEALLVSEKRFSTAFESSPMLSTISTLAEGRFLAVNGTFINSTGYSRAEAVGHTALELNLWPNPEERKTLMQLLEKEGTILNYEAQIRLKNGEHRVLLLSVEKIELQGQTCLLHAGIDITERKQTEATLRKSQEQLRALSARIQSVQEEEGTRISREIHDQLGGALTGLKWDLETMDKQIGESTSISATDLRQQIKKMSGAIESTIDTVRRIAQELRPSVLDDLGLVAALEWQAMQIQSRTGLKCHWQTEFDEIDLKPECATAVFRVFQEVLTNVLRHSQARNVYVKLQKKNGKMELEVTDDGRGITENEKVNTNSLGLLGMKERTLLVGGEIDIKGATGEGTSVVVRIPLADKQQGKTGSL